MATDVESSNSSTIGMVNQKPKQIINPEMAINHPR